MSDIRVLMVNKMCIEWIKRDIWFCGIMLSDVMGE